MFDATPFLRLYAWRRASQLAQLDSVACQQHQLKLLLQKAAHTAFGKDHDFSRLLSVDDYQAAVPLRTYEGFWADYWKAGFPILEDCTWPGRMTCFSLTSGTTTGKTKYIPYTKELKQSNAKAGLDLLTYHLLNRPASRILDGKCFVLGGSTGLQKLAPGVVAGDLSGIATTDLPLWIKP